MSDKPDTTTEIPKHYPPDLDGLGEPTLPKEGSLLKSRPPQKSRRRKVNADKAILDSPAKVLLVIVFIIMLPKLLEAVAVLILVTMFLVLLYVLLKDLESW